MIFEGLAMAMAKMFAFLVKKKSYTIGKLLVQVGKKKCENNANPQQSGHNTWSGNNTSYLRVYIFKRKESIALFPSY